MRFLEGVLGAIVFTLALLAITLFFPLVIAVLVLGFLGFQPFKKWVDDTEKQEKDLEKRESHKDIYLPR